jgi:hypothetical protein
MIQLEAKGTLGFFNQNAVESVNTIIAMPISWTW